MSTSVQSRPQTSRQVKAAYKARGQPTISEREQRQLQRAVELDRRAWKAKETEKRRAEAVQKRVEKERKEREDRARLLYNQRPADKFGFKGSQLHLSAFFGNGAGKKLSTIEDGNHSMTLVDGYSDVSEDDFVDDDTLPSVLGTTVSKDTGDIRDQGARSAQAPSALIVSSNQPEPPMNLRTTVPSDDTLAEFLDELGSSTQVAREIASEKGFVGNSVLNERTVSFASGDFDLSTEDLDELNPSEPVADVFRQNKELMRPPSLPIKRDWRASNDIVHAPVSEASASLLDGRKSGETALSDAGLCQNDLEIMAAQEVQLTQDTAV